jgi:hypothetical protein
MNIWVNYLNWKSVIYLVITAVVTVIGFFVPQFVPSFVRDYPSQSLFFSLSLGLTFMILGLMFSLIIDIWMHEKGEERALPVRIILGQRELKKMYNSLRDRACEMKTVWCSRYAEVDKYFTEEKDDFRDNAKLTIKRLVNPDVQSSDYQRHLSETRTLRSTGRYSVKTTDLAEMECVVCEYETKGQKEWKALLVFCNIDNHTPVLGILLDPTENPETGPSLAAIDSWFDKEWRRGGSVP